MIINPYFAFCPINNRFPIRSNNTPILTNKDKGAIKDIISYMVLNTIGSIVGILTTFSCSFGDRFSLTIKDKTTINKRSPFNILPALKGEKIISVIVVLL